MRSGQRKAEVSRRVFLHGGVSIGAAVGGSMIAREALVRPTRAAGEGGAHQWAFVVDLRRCDGCERCTAACQTMHYLGKEQVWIRVYRITSPTGQQHFMPRLCMHCE